VTMFPWTSGPHHFKGTSEITCPMTWCHTPEDLTQSSK